MGRWGNWIFALQSTMLRALLRLSFLLRIQSSRIFFRTDRELPRRRRDERMRKLLAQPPDEAAGARAHEKQTCKNISNGSIRTPSLRHHTTTSAVRTLPDTRDCSSCVTECSCAVPFPSVATQGAAANVAFLAAFRVGTEGTGRRALHNSTSSVGEAGVGRVG